MKADIRYRNDLKDINSDKRTSIILNKIIDYLIKEKDEHSVTIPLNL